MIFINMVLVFSHNVQNKISEINAKIDKIFSFKLLKTFQIIDTDGLEPTGLQNVGGEILIYKINYDFEHLKRIFFK